MNHKSQPPQFDATKYVEFRPTYPDSLYEFIFKRVKTFELAWDCGCGNGQAVLPLSRCFKQVVATDISDEQIKLAPHYANVSYFACRAEQSPLQTASVDLITVAQALHWFATDEFYHEVRRVLKPQGILAAWCYDLPQINPKLNQLVIELAYGTLKDYWAFGREFIQSKYQDIPFPFEKNYNADFFAEKRMDFAGFIGYLQSWSPRLKYLQEHGIDPLVQAKDQLLAAWGDPQALKTVRYPLYLLLGKTSGTK